MSKNKTLKILALFNIVAALLGACGNASSDSAISTAVALTVAAQKTQEITPTPTLIPTATTPPNITFPTPTRLLSPIPTQTSANNADASCARANYISQTIPDGTIMKPGHVFTQTWQIKNSSTCVWNTTYKVVYWDGNIMGGAYVYNLPEAVAPEDTLDLSLVLTAPATEGEFSGYWMLQTPKGVNFGVGQYSEPFFLKIVVSKSDAPEYRITKVDFDVIRDPAAGCATNVRYNYNAQVEANGPIKIRYGFKQSDGTTQWKDDLEFTEAGTKTATGVWAFHLGSTPGEKWAQFVVLQPYYQEFEKQYFSYLCGNTP